MRRKWVLVLGAGSIIMALSMGVRQVSGLFLRPVAMDLDISREIFGAAIALQNIVWGLTQPLAGLLSDRFGARFVAFTGGLLYLTGLIVAALATNGAAFVLGLGVIAGLGQSGTAFAVILAVIGRNAPANSRSFALGIGSTASSMGMFAFVPLTAALLDNLDWRTAMLVLAALIGAILILAWHLDGDDQNEVTAEESDKTSSRVAFLSAGSDRDYWLLNIGFAVCGFQLAFIATYLPTILVDGGLSITTGAAVLGVIGLFNIGGTYIAGLAGGRWLKTRVLAAIYVARAVIIIVFLLTPLSTISAIIFGAAIGLLWTATVPLTSALVADLWGRRNLAFLFGLVYVGHQVGAFTGAWTGGFAFDRTGSFDVVWITMIFASVAAAIMHLVLLEKPRPIALAEGRI